MSNQQIAGLNVLITGGSTGIGAEIAREVARHGGHPILVARSESKLLTLKDNIEKEYNQEVDVYPCDLTDSKKWEDTLHKIVEQHKPIHVFINNAGMGVFEYVKDITSENTRKMFDLNVYSLIQGTQIMVGQMLLQKEGHIINIASQAGKMATPRSSVYSATKHAVLGFTNALRLEMHREPIHVTAVNLGPVATNFFDEADPNGRYQEAVKSYMLDPAKVAQKVVKSIYTNKREINMPGWMEAGSFIYRMMPSLMERVLRKQFEKK
ncbi:SDR family oxidoreductase [Bacillaceae bacterium S4-13-56]